MSGVGVTAKRGANSPEFIGCDGCADAAAADEDANLCLTLLNSLADFQRVIGIIVRSRTNVRAKVDELMSRCAQFFADSFIERITTVVSTDCNSHALNFAQSSALARLRTLSRLKPSSRITTSPGAEA